jgi:hypothetical protein
MPRYTHVRDTRRFGCDQEADREDLRRDLRDVLDDPDTDYGDLHAILCKHFPEEAGQVHREVSEDRRGVHAWAKDRRERRRLSKDMGMRRDRRLGRDFGPENLTEPGPSRSIEEFERTRTASDMAMDARARRNPGFASFSGRDRQSSCGRGSPGPGSAGSSTHQRSIIRTIATCRNTGAPGAGQRARPRAAEVGRHAVGRARRR